VSHGMSLSNRERSIIRIGLAVSIIVALGAVGMIFYMNSWTPKAEGPGTTVLPANPTEHGLYHLTGDNSKPLGRLLPEGWRNAERSILIGKSRRVLTVRIGSKPIKSYFIALGGKPVGTKTRTNDRKTPEGTFYVCSKNPRSSYEMSLLLSYPGADEARDGLRRRLIDKKTMEKILSEVARHRTPPQETALGGYICIHGGGIGAISADLKTAKISDWTLGCVALRSEDVKEVYDFAQPGTAVVIKP
jgi:hypothetical protein